MYPDWIYRQSAALPYRWHDGGLEVLLVTTRSGRRWSLPKGIVEPGLSPPVSAAREAREEAGLEGAVSAKTLGRYRQKKWGGTCRIEVFPLRVSAELKEWPEAEVRRRKWLSVKAAAKRVEDKKLCKILKSLPKALRKKETVGAAAAPVETRRLIYLLRHTKSSWDDPTLADFDRPLAERGRIAGETLCDYFRVADIAPDVVLCSSAVRTRETLAAIRSALGESVQTRFDKQIYLGRERALLTRLRRLPETANSVMLIGHNPALQALALDLADEVESDSGALGRLTAKFPTGALATFVVRDRPWQDLAFDSCALHSVVTPRELVA